MVGTGRYNLCQLKNHKGINSSGTRWRAAAAAAWESRWAARQGQAREGSTREGLQQPPLDSPAAAGAAALAPPPLSRNQVSGNLKPAFPKNVGTWIKKLENPGRNRKHLYWEGCQPRQSCLAQSTLHCSTGKESHIPNRRLDIFTQQDAKKLKINKAFEEAKITQKHKDSKALNRCQNTDST